LIYNPPQPPFTKEGLGEISLLMLGESSYPIKLIEKDFNMFQTYRRSLKKNSQKLRSKMTVAELALWQKIRRKQICGFQFYRQKPLLNFIVDFYCPKAHLVIEVDGGQHFEILHFQNDAERDQLLRKQGIVVLRFDNLQVLNQIEDVLEVIERFVVSKIKKHNPPQSPFE